MITSGTPEFPFALDYAPFKTAAFVHRVSPGTIIYSDTTTDERMSATLGFQYAAIVVATVMSHPRPNRFTCAGGHEAVAADAGVPTCAVIGIPDAKPLAPQALPPEPPPHGRPVPPRSPGYRMCQA